MINQEQKTWLITRLHARIFLWKLEGLLTKKGSLKTLLNHSCKLVFNLPIYLWLLFRLKNIVGIIYRSTYYLFILFYLFKQYGFFTFARGARIDVNLQLTFTDCWHVDSQKKKTQQQQTETGKKTKKIKQSLLNKLENTSKQIALLACTTF